MFDCSATPCLDSSHSARRQISGLGISFVRATDFRSLYPSAPCLARFRPVCVRFVLGVLYRRRGHTSSLSGPFPHLYRSPEIAGLIDRTLFLLTPRSVFYGQRPLIAPPLASLRRHQTRSGSRSNLVSVHHHGL